VQSVSIVFAVVLLLNVAVGTLAAVRAREPASLLVAALLFGTGGTTVLLLLAEPLGQPALRDVALVLVALASLVVLVFVHRGRPVHPNRGRA
jgi:multicomponent Na+:H+ antiporter subunit F